MGKKRTVAVALALLSACMLTACGSDQESDKKGAASSTESTDTGSSNTESAKADNSKTSDVTHIEFFQMKKEAVDTVDYLISEFEKQHPEIDVEQVTVPDGETVLMTRAAADDLPDIFTHYPIDANFTNFVKEGKVLDITGKPCTENIDPEYLKSAEIDGKNYIAPISVEYNGIYYEENSFKEKGYEVPETWGDLVALADKMKENGETPFILSNKDGWTTSYLWTGIMTKDMGSYKDFYEDMKAGKDSFSQNPIAKTTLEKAKWVIDNAQNDSISVSYDQAITDFVNGKGMMMPSGSFVLPSLQSANPDASFKIFPWPTDTGETKETVRVDWAIAAGKNSNDNKEAVDTFMEYLTSTEAAQIFSDRDHSLSAIKGVVPDIPEAQKVVDSVEKNGVLDAVAPPPGFEQEKRAELQELVMDGDVTKCLNKLDEIWKELTAE